MSDEAEGAAFVAAAMAIQDDGDSLARLLSVAITAKAHREGRAIEVADWTDGIAILLAAAWQLTQWASPGEEAQPMFSDFLHRFAKSIETKAQ